MLMGKMGAAYLRCPRSKPILVIHAPNISDLKTITFALLRGL